MKYGKVIHGKFVRRINRFIAEVDIDGDIERVHVKNTGRLKELFQKDAAVLLEVSDNPARKTRFSLIAANKQGMWVNIDSQAPNRLAYEALKAGQLLEFGLPQVVKKEVTYGTSRFDLYYERGEERGFVEVKGVTLERQGVAMFPDAPTARGTKHVMELVKAVQEGYQGWILFIVQMKGCHLFTPNREMDPAFSDALVEAARQGVEIIAYDSLVTENELLLGEPIPVRLE